MKRSRFTAISQTIIWIFLIAFILGTLLLHKRGNDFAGSLVIAYGGARYREGVRLLSIAVGAIILPLLVRNLWKDRHRIKQLLIFIPVALIIDQTMMSVPLERIHYVQYGFLTWVFYLAIGQPLAAAFLALLVGYVDEAQQYWLLYAGDPIQYFDWNDIALNLLGVVGALILILPRLRLGRVDIKRTASIVILWIAGAALLVGFYKPDRYLFRDDPYKGSGSFWIASTDRSYHVMNALEGMVFIGVIWIVVTAFYWNAEPPKASAVSGAADSSHRLAEELDHSLS